ncbi:MAG: asparagine synthetase B [Candidatus Eiseniibacteriota bacterium]
MVLCATLAGAAAARILVPMDLVQTDHLKAYGLAYWVLERGQTAEWLLNYRGGSFLLPDSERTERKARLMGVTLERVSGDQVGQIYATIEAGNMEVVLLETPPRVAIYTPPSSEPWDDAVTLALEYAEIEYTTLYDDEVLAGELDQYDWLHLHHEDFTGQYGRFYAGFRGAAWYQQRQQLYEQMAHRAGFEKVSQHKLAVALEIRNYIARGGFVFAMCSATDTFDIALAARNTDICAEVFDHDPMDPQCQEKLDYSECLAFENFRLELNPLVYEFSDIDTSNYRIARGPEADYFTLFDFSAKHDPVPSMLTQCHVAVVNGFFGQTTGFRRDRIKDSVTILGEVEGTDEVKYIHGHYGQGTFTWFGGHDPEDYQHAVGDPPTNLALHKNSPGYRLILNNILFPAAEKKEQKT